MEIIRRKKKILLFEYQANNVARACELVRDVKCTHCIYIHREHILMYTFNAGCEELKVVY